MYIVLGAFTLSLIISFIILPSILFVSHKRSLYDTPDERKIHKYPVPRLGGISFYPVILITMLSSSIYCTLSGEVSFLESDGLRTQFSALCIGGMSLYLVGVKDDLVNVGYKSKFGVQILAGVLLAISGLWIDSFGGISILDAIPASLGVPLSVFLCVYITNAFNLIDGVDGLASGLAIIAFATMGFLFLSSYEVAYSLLAFSGVGCLIPFFWKNVRRSPGNKKKLFMGDTGSLTLGYLLSFLFFSLCINTTTFHPLDSRFHYIAFGALVIPLFDVVRVVLIRLRNGNPPFLPDRNHIHHKLMRAGMTDTQVMLSLLTLSLFFILCNYVLTGYLYGSVVFFIDLIIWMMFHGILNIVIKRANQNEKNNDNSKLKLTSTK